MSGYPGGFGGGSNEPGEGYDGGQGDAPYGMPSSAASAASAWAASSQAEGYYFPAWGVVLVVGGSGLVMVCVWLCVRSICLKLRARQRSAVRDLEAQQQQSERFTARMLREGDAKEVENQSKPCEADVGVQMTFVVMAGEDQPSYLACPATRVPSTIPEKFENKEQQKSATSCPSPSDFSHALTLTPNPPPESYLKTPLHHPDHLSR